MELAINEVKTQAKKLLKALKVDNNLVQRMQIPLKKAAVPTIDELKLKHCLSMVSIELGFSNWHEAKEILSGTKPLSEVKDMGSFFYPKGCGGFINEWFADYQLAKSAVDMSSHKKWLLPYKNQFIVVEHNYITVFNLPDKLAPLWGELSHNMVAGYNSSAWDKLACAVIKNRVKSY